MKKLTIILSLFFLGVGSSFAQVTAKKTATLQVDTGAIGRVNPGDTLRYTIIISNSSAAVVTNVVLTDTNFPNQTLVGASIKSTPIARPDAYTAIGNTILAVPAVSGLLTNDSDPDGDSLSIVAFGATSANGGTVAVTNNGSFSYLPAAGFKGADSFTYTISDGNGGSNTATATIFVSNMVWYVNNSGANGDGRQTSPLNSFTGINGAGGAGDFDGTNDYIYLFQGSGSYGSGLILESAQKLVGAGVALVVGGTAVLPAGSRPTLGSGGAGVTCSTNNLIQGLNIVATAGKGVFGISVGTLAISNTSISATGGAALDIDTGTLAVLLDSASSTNSSAEGLRLNNCGGSLVANAGAILAPTGAGILISGGTASVTYPGNVTKNNAGRVVDISSKSGGTVALSGTLSQNSASGTGISLVSNSGATINFTGAVTLNTSANTAFSATGGGTVTATASGNTLTTTTATALNVVNTTIGASGLKFQSISSSGGSATGIILDNTGSSGGLTVTGTGSAGSGGTITGKTGADLATTTGIGIYLNNCSSVSLASMQLNDFQNFAIRGATVSGFVLTNSVISSTGGGWNGSNSAGGFNEGSVSFSNLTGTAVISHTSISGGFADNFRVVNYAGTLNRITFDVVTIGPNSSGAAVDGSQDNGNDGISLESQNAAVVNVTVQNSSFSSSRGDLFQLNNIGTAVDDLVFTGNHLSNNYIRIATGGGGVTIGDNGTGGLTYNIANNTFRDAVGTAVLIVKATGSSSVIGTFTGNAIGATGVANSGSHEGDGIKLQSTGLGVFKATLKNNVIQQYNNFGINMVAGGGAVATSGTFENVIAGNTIGPIGSNTSAAQAQGIGLNSGTIVGDTWQTYLALGGVNAGDKNTVSNWTASNGLQDIRLRQRQSTTVHLTALDAGGSPTVNYAGGATDVAAVQTFFQTYNTSSGNNSASASGSGGGFVGGAPP